MEIVNSKQLGEIVRHHRRKADLSQLELAQLAGTGKTAVFDLEKGKATVKLQTILKLLAVLNIKIDLQSPLMK